MAENPTARKISHIGLWCVVAGIGVWLVYSATHTTTENNKYGSGTTPITFEEHNYGLFNLKPCGVLFSFDSPQKRKTDVDTHPNSHKH